MANTKLIGKEKENKEKQKKAAVKAPKKSIGQYFRDVFAELKKVTWPTFKNLAIYTGAVIIFVIIMIIITGAYDYALSWIRSKVVGV